MRKNLAPLLLMVILSGCGGDTGTLKTGATHTDATGTAVVLETIPARVVSLAPSLTEQLFLLGAGDRVVGVTTYCRVPESATGTTKVGTVQQPMMETIMALKPDLVLATKEGNVEKKIAKLRELGLTVYVTGQSKSIDDIFRHFETLGRLLGREEAAARATAEARGALAEVTKKLTGKKRATVFVQIGEKPLFTVGGDTFCDGIVRAAGGENIARDGAGGYPRYHEETVIAKNPDAILIVRMGPVQEAAARWKRFSSMNAVRNNRIYTIDEHSFCSPSPAGVVTSVREIAKHLHPEAFGK